MLQEITLLDLFAGIGGLSLGFEMAGATPLAALESNESHATYYAHNRSSPVAIFTEPINELEPRVVMRELGIRKRTLDLVIGGPPCQPFSSAGKRNGTDDERGTLVADFARFVKEIQPKAFVMENVVGLRSIHDGEYLNEVILSLSSAGYRCNAFVLDAADFGVPQRRRRLFLVGARDPSIDIGRPTPTHGPMVGPLLAKRYLTVRDAISDLPLVSTDAEVTDQTLVGYSSAPNEYQKKLRGSCRKVSGNGITRHLPHILHAIDRIRLPEGAVHESTRYRRLRWEAPSVTLRAGSGSFTALRPIHPDEPRVITVREAARIQSFPDSFVFAAQRKLAHQQIGNSVPPLLAKAIAEKLIDSIRRSRARA